MCIFSTQLSLEQPGGFILKKITHIKITDIKKDRQKKNPTEIRWLYIIFKARQQKLYNN
jgi:hypothetical protein